MIENYVPYSKKPKINEHHAHCSNIFFPFRSWTKLVQILPARIYVIKICVILEQMTLSIMIFLQNKVKNKALNIKVTIIVESGKYL